MGIIVVLLIVTIAVVVTILAIIIVICPTGLLTAAPPPPIVIPVPVSSIIDIIISKISGRPGTAPMMMHGMMPLLRAASGLLTKLRISSIINPGNGLSRLVTRHRRILSAVS